MRLPAPTAQINIWAPPFPPPDKHLGFTCCSLAHPHACALAACATLGRCCGQPVPDVQVHAASIAQPDPVSALNEPFAPSSASITKTGLLGSTGHSLGAQHSLMCPIHGDGHLLSQNWDPALANLTPGSPVPCPALAPTQKCSCEPQGRICCHLSLLKFLKLSIHFFLSPSS